MAPKLSQFDEAPVSAPAALRESVVPAVSHSVKGRVRNCVDCPHHAVVPDPDPTDWFCDDDVALLCGLIPNPSENPDEAWSGGIAFPHRAVTVSCRPYAIRKESETPDWCPIE